MKKTLKKILCSLLVVVMCMTSAPLQGFVDISWLDFSVKAKALATTGKCGSNVYWSYDSITKKLVLSGTGRTSSFSHRYANESPFYNSDIKILVVEEGVNVIDNHIFAACHNLESVTIADSVTTIGEGAFEYGYNLTNVTIGASMKNIGDFAFSQCYNLKNVIIPNSVTTIGDCAFAHCTNLTNVIIGDSVTSIGHNAFYGCQNLVNITIPDSIITIHDLAFAYCDSLAHVYYAGTEEQWKKIDFGPNRGGLDIATIHYNYKPSYFMVSSDQYSVGSIHRKETATYKINLLDENSGFLPIDDVTVQNNTTDIVSISTKKISDTELELTVEPIKEGAASISLFNGDNSNPQYFSFTVYSNTTTYRADQVPVTNEKLKTNFSRGDLTVDNFEYYFDENKGKYIATMDVYNSSGAIGVVSAYTQDGKISDIEQVDPYIPLPGDFGEFLVYLGTGAVSYLKGESFNYRYAGDSKKTSIEIEVPEDGYLTVSCDVTADNAAFMYNLVSLATDIVFKTSGMIEALAKVGDTDEVAKKTKDTLAEKVYEYFNEDVEWTEKAISKITKKTAEQFSGASLAGLSMLSVELVEEMFKNSGKEFSKLILEVIGDVIKEEIKDFGVMAAAKNLIENEIIEVAEETLLKVASIMFDGGSYVNLVNSILGTYRYNVGTGKTDIVFKPKGEDGFLCKDTIKVTSDIITDEVLLNTYIIKDTQKEDAFVRGRIHPYFNRDDGLDDREISIDLNRVVEIHEISLLKNGQVVTDGFTATVEMYLPSYIDRRTCSVYRVEKDGTYTKLDTRIEDGKIIFETDHFSEYILTGIRNVVAGTTPCDDHIYEEVRIEPSCSEAGSITYTCYCGDTYVETIVAKGHVFSGSECINCDYDKGDDCSCNCHKGGIIGFFWKIINFFYKLFRINPTCACEVKHW